MSNNLIEFSPSAYQYPLLIKHLLHYPLAHSPEQEIVYRDLRRHTYRTFRERIGRLASGLSQIGVKQGDVVAVLDWDSHRYHECYFAVPMMGAVLQTVNLTLAPEQLVFVLNDAGPSTVLVNADFLPLVEKLADKLQTVRKFVLLHDGKQRPITRLPIECEYEELLESSSPFFQFPDFDENTRATTFHTTGTTGRPKGVYFSHRQLVLHTLAGLVEYGLAPSQGRFHREDVYMPMTPMFHVHAWGCPYTATLSGAKQVYPGRYSPDVLLRLIAQEGVTFTHCVPTILQMLLTAPGSKDVDLSRLKVAVGGSAMPRSLARAALARGIDVFAGYGQSESCPGLTVTHMSTRQLSEDPERQVEYRTFVGPPEVLVDLRVVDADMEDVPRDGKTQGEIIARAPWLTMGYLNNPEASEQLWAGGYLHTGDVATWDADGCVHLTDRLKDIIKSGGEWISSIQLEDIILEKKGILRAAVIAVRDAKWGERPMALVVLDPEFTGKVEEDAIRDHVRSYVDKGIIAKLAVPELIMIVKELPLTTVGKIDKKVLRERYQRQEAA
ncbi:MAG: fatty acid--CoA ligase [Xanthobacteraceae bacterium]|jgi:fatty-acyl-CoA synthase